MLFSDTRRHSVMCTDTATTAGVLDDFVIDPTTANIVALKIKNAGGAGDVVHWEDLSAFGADIITVATAEAITTARGRAAELDGKRSRLMGKHLLTDTGTDLGTVNDIDFDPATGALISLITANGPIDAHRLINSGGYATIIKTA
jgi:sporulation protein YlmC with PRC-barrel domain